MNVMLSRAAKHQRVNSEEQDVLPNDSQMDPVTGSAKEACMDFESSNTQYDDSNQCRICF